MDADLARVLALLEELGLQDAVVCTHGEVIEQVRPGWSPTGGGRPAVGVAQGVDLAAGRCQRAIHACPPPVPTAPGPCSEHGIDTRGRRDRYIFTGPVTCAGCQFSTGRLSSRVHGCLLQHYLKGESE